MRSCLRKELLWSPRSRDPVPRHEDLYAITASLRHPPPFSSTGSGAATVGGALVHAGSGAADDVGLPGAARSAPTHHRATRPHVRGAAAAEGHQLALVGPAFSSDVDADQEGPASSASWPRLGRGADFPLEGSSRAGRQGRRARARLAAGDHDVMMIFGAGAGWTSSSAVRKDKWNLMFLRTIRARPTCGTRSCTALLRRRWTSTGSRGGT